MFFNDSVSKIVNRPSTFSVFRHALIEVMNLCVTTNKATVVFKGILKALGVVIVFVDS